MNNNYICTLYYDTLEELDDNFYKIVEWCKGNGLVYRYALSLTHVRRGTFSTLTWGLKREVYFADEKIYTLFLLTFSRYIK